MHSKISLWIIVAIIAGLPRVAAAWSVCGHDIISLLAYDAPDEMEQRELLSVLAKHPRYEEDFSPPKKVWNVLRLRVGRAGYWPDVARDLEPSERAKYNRPTCHYELGATLAIGDDSSVKVPADPGPLPEDASLDTDALHASQAILLCQKIMSDKTQSESDRALALCWLCRLIADIHQPCHTGSLYVENVFPEGDRGANSIKTQGGNLHLLWDGLLWDGLLGRQFNEGDIERRRLEIINNIGIRPLGRRKVPAIPLEAWVFQGRELGRSYVYTTEVLGPIRAVSRGAAENLPALKFSKDYLKKAGTLAQRRAAAAAYNLAWVWRGALRPQ